MKLEEAHLRKITDHDTDYSSIKICYGEQVFTSKHLLLECPAEMEQQFSPAKD